MTTAATTPSRPESTSRRALFLTGALIVAAVIVALIVSLASGGSESSQNSSAGESANIPAGAVRQVSFAEVEGSSLPPFDPAGVDPAIGAAAPPITASYFTNNEVRIDTADGRARVLIFLAHWCPHCQAEVASLAPWFSTNSVPADVEVLAISTSVDEGAPNYPPSSWLLREEWPVPVLRDSANNDLAAGYGLTGFPFIVVINEDGDVASRTSGQVTIAEWEALLASVAADGASG